MLRNTFWMVLALASAPALADPGLDAVKNLGRLNGTALACGQMALVDRIRSHVVYEAAKTREVGEVFEAATNERYLTMGKDSAACPDAKTLAGEIETGIAALRQTVTGGKQ